MAEQSQHDEWRGLGIGWLVVNITGGLGENNVLALEEQREGALHNYFGGRCF